MFCLAIQKINKILITWIVHIFEFYLPRFNSNLILKWKAIVCIVGGCATRLSVLANFSVPPRTYNQIKLHGNRKNKLRSRNRQPPRWAAQCVLSLRLGQDKSRKGISDSRSHKDKQSYEWIKLLSLFKIKQMQLVLHYIK